MAAIAGVIGTQNPDSYPGAYTQERTDKRVQVVETQQMARNVRWVMHWQMDRETVIELRCSVDGSEVGLPLPYCASAYLVSESSKQ